MLLNLVNRTDGDRGKWDVDHGIRSGFDGHEDGTGLPFVPQTHDEVGCAECAAGEGQHPKQTFEQGTVVFADVSGETMVNLNKYVYGYGMYFNTLSRAIKYCSNCF